MGQAKRIVALFLIAALVVPIFIMLSLASASAATVPSTPQFTIKTTNHSFDIAPKSSTDPFTGKTTTTQGTTIQWQTLDLTVSNEKYIGRTVNEYQNYYGFLYYVRYKGNYAQNWIEENLYNYYFHQNTNQSSTTLSFVLNGNYVDLVQDGVPDTLVPPHAISLPSDGKVDFQVKAKIGELYQGISFGRPLVFDGTESGWSNILTIDLVDGSVAVTEVPQTPTNPPSPSIPAETQPPTTAPTQTPMDTANPTQSGTPQGFGFWVDWQTVVIVVLAVVVVALALIVVLQRKNRIHPKAVS